MKRKRAVSRIFAALFALAGLTLGTMGIRLALTSVQAGPVLVQVPETARERVTAMLDLACAGDFEGAGSLMQGSPSLGAARDPADPAGKVLWDAFVESLSYELVGQLYATDSGVAQDVTITALVPDSVTGGLRGRTQTLLQQRLEEAEDVSQIYDENNNFREDVVLDALLEATRQAVAEDGTTQTVQVTVELIYLEGQWWIVVTEDLLRALSGGILK